jgi:hypothetical protein
VQQADGAVHQRHHRFAGGFGVAVGHGGSGLLMQHRQDLGFAVAAVIDQRFVQALERGAGIDGDVVEVERLQHVDHVVRARMPDELRPGARLGGHEVRARVGFRRPRHTRPCRHSLLGGGRARDDRARGTGGPARRL